MSSRGKNKGQNTGKSGRGAAAKEGLGARVKSSHGEATTNTPATTTASTATTPATTKAATVVVRRKEVKTEYKPVLVLTKSFLNQVEFLHRNVERNTEWSAILLYDSLEGSVDDPNNWVIRVKDLILMDVGTSAYTEYDMEADDEHATDKWMDHLEAGGKMGHLHTHHNMICYFSGVDTQELHDNAPNHNYYLSLIVNYKDTSNWCAKVAICGTQVQAGEITTTTSWNGAAGAMSKRSVQPVQVSEDLLFTMDCTIKCEESEDYPEDLRDRLKEILVNKAKARTTTAAASTTHTPSVAKDLGYQRHATTPSTTSPRTPYSAPGSSVHDNDDFDWEELYSGQGVIEPRSAKDFDQETREDSFSKERDIVSRFSPGRVTPLFIKLITDDMDCEDTLERTLMDMEILKIEELYEHFGKIEDKFKAHFSKFYSMELTSLHLHAIAVSIYDALLAYESFNAFDPIDVMLTQFLLVEGEFSPAVIKQMTGLDVKDQVCIEKDKADA